jgi:hypothetical protein
MSTIIFPEIVEGSLVRFKYWDKNPDAQTCLLRWKRAYGPGPFKVLRRPDPSHVVLEDGDGKTMHFGSTANPSLNIEFVRLWGV